MNRREIGTKYEKRALIYLEQQGYQILEKNYRCRTGEIDIIARDGTYLVFIEVKYRASGKMGHALEAVTSRKREVIRKVASYYLLTHGMGMDVPCRFDVVGITGEEVMLIKNAF